jgi:hypothetical protein
MITYTIDETAGLATLTYAGTPTDKEFREAMLAIFADARYRPGFSFVADRRSVEAPTTDYVRRVTDFMNGHRTEMAGSRWATVVASLAGYGMARMGQVFAHGHPAELGIFTDLDEAVAWLVDRRRDETA